MKNDKPKLDLRTALEILHEANSDDEIYSMIVCNNACKEYGISGRKLSIRFQFAEMLEKVGILKNTNSDSNQKRKLPSKR